MNDNQTVQSLIAFGLAKSTAQRLVGLPHIAPDMVTRWLAYLSPARAR